MEKKNQGIQSVEQAFDIIEFFVNTRDAISLGDASKQMNLAKSKLHKYLASLSRMGIVQQDANGNYYNGSRLLELSAKIIGQTDLIQLCEPVLQQLRLKSGQAVALAIWSTKGPLIIRFLENPSPVAVRFKVGFYAPLTQSAAGRCFAAFLPESAYAHILDEELKNENQSAGEFFEELAVVRAQGYAERVLGNDTIPGAKAVAVPVFDALGNIAASVLLLGFDEHRAIPECDKDLLTSLGSSLSAKLGYDAMSS